jgi:hypothetical protein
MANSGGEAGRQHVREQPGSPEHPDISSVRSPVSLPGEHAGALPHSLRATRRFKYDLDAFPFPSLVAELLGCGSGDDLLRLHERPEAQQWLSACHTNGARAYAMRRNVIDCRFKEAGGFRTSSRLRLCYERFVREVAAPLVAAGLEGAEHLDSGMRGPVEPATPGCYQRDPNLRVHLAGTGHHLTQRHKDAQYHHQPLELNFWIPLTRAHGTNTLFVESAPGAGDFSPFELGPGEGIQFWGHACEHYTLPNETGETRVSFDFRFVPPGMYRERYPNSHKSDGTPRFAIGGFFDTLESCGRTDVVEGHPGNENRTTC